MKYQVTLHNGQGFQITLSKESSIEKIYVELNDRNTSFVNLGGCIVHKNTVATVLPIEENA